VVKPDDDDAPRPEDVDGGDADPAPESDEASELDSMATMASGIHKRPPPPSQAPSEPELPATFTGEEVEEDDLSTIGAEYGDPFENLEELPSNAPTEISGFVVKGLIAQGGMGAVYLAMQRRPRRPVAIKVIKTGVASPMALKRFEFEAQMLARLTHPGIAQIYEAGTFDQGDGAAPFFAMEYVPNARLIDEYCEEHNLDTRAKVELIAQVCEAVGSGHAKGIIHRDLKPGNILVSSSGHPKIIDFGVARSTDSDQRVTMQTDVHAIVGTLQYMAPEQCAGDVLDLDTSADVYALGVALYELLTGKLPYEVSGGIATAIKTVTEARPDPISIYDKSLGGDLEVIVSKAMAKERSDRYRTASELGDDLHRWLNDEPIMAQPPTLVTSFKRLVRRNKGLAVGVVAMAAVLALAVTGGVLALVNRNLALETQNELLEEQSHKRAMVGDLIAFFMRDSFDAIAVLSNSQEARESLVNVSLEYLQQLREQAGNDPTLQRMLAEGLQQAGINQWSLRSGNRGNVDDATLKWEESILIADELRAADMEDTKALMLAVRGRSLLFDAYRRSGRIEDMERVIEEAEALSDAFPEATENIEQGRLVMGVLLDRSRLVPDGVDPEQDPAFKRMLSTVNQLQDSFEDDLQIQRDGTLAWNRLAHAWSTRGNHEKALEWYQKSLSRREDMLSGREATNTFRRDINTSRRGVADQLLSLGRNDEAIAIYRNDIVPLQRELVADSPSDIRARDDLAKGLREYGLCLLFVDQGARAVTPLSEARIGWSEAAHRVGKDRGGDQLATRQLCRTEIALSQAYLAAGDANAAKAAIDRAIEAIRAARKQWPDSQTFKSLNDQAKQVRASVLEQVGSFGQ